MVFSKEEGLREKGKACLSHVCHAWTSQSPSMYVRYKSQRVCWTLGARATGIWEIVTRCVTWVLRAELRQTV